MASFDVSAARARFPAFRPDSPTSDWVDLDGPAGTQVPASVIEAMAAAHRDGLSNLGGGFPASDRAEQIVTDARSAFGDLFAARPEEIVFGPNMTTLTFAVSRALSQRWGAGDEIVVTLLDHDANVTPWRMAAADRGVTVRTVPFDTATGMLAPEAVAAAVGPRTRLVAVTHASNALGTVPDVAAIVEVAHAAGALAYVDAVHFAPHGVVDVAAIDADFLVASSYKFFGPHLGALYGKEGLLEATAAYKVVPAPDTGPGKWETGTANFEALAGATAAVEHLAEPGSGPGRRERLIDAQRQVRSHEEALIDRFLAGAAEIPGLRVYGVTDPDLISHRVPTFAVGVAGMPVGELEASMRARRLAVRAGHYYAVGVMEHLGVLDDGGLLRIGFVQYTTADEVDRTLEGLAAAAAG